MTTEKANGTKARLRCAIYTRKSTEEGLEQSFNSLDAQREAGEAYIASQRHEGWTQTTERYDDGGFSGGNMDRPALKRLLADIDASKVDVVVVYKVDRLSRSLLDFARIMESFERRGISFVSVTQQFNTATSMGRLILNVLLSFAQFEREMIAERTKDKMGAARRKGKWVGGRPPFGYDVDSRGGRLTVNADEAEVVREAFRLYEREQSLLRVAELLNGRGLRMKTWVTKKGEKREGGRWDKSGVRRLLTNVTYIGKVKYENAIYAGEHEPIIGDEVFRRVEDALAQGRHDRRGRFRNRHGFLLRGLVRCKACEGVMTSSTSAPRGKPYRYYACVPVAKRGRSACEVRSVPADTLEQFVVSKVFELGRNPALVKAVVEQVAADQQKDVPRLDKEQRRLEREHRQVRDEAKQLLSTLGTQSAGDGRLASERLGELDNRAADIERRLQEIEKARASIVGGVIMAEDAEKAVRLFEPAWDGLTTRERARALEILIDAIEFDGRTGDLGIILRPAGVALLARDAARVIPAREVA